MSTSLTPVQIATADQGQKRYFGQDIWSNPVGALNAGTKLVQLDYRQMDFIKAENEVISHYFTDVDTFNKCISHDKPHSLRVLAELLQVGPRRLRRNTGIHIYAKHIAVYELQRDLLPHEFAEAPVSNNGHFGGGTGKQFFIVNEVDLLRDKTLILNSVNIGTEIEHGLHWLSLLEDASEIDADIDISMRIAWEAYTKSALAGGAWAGVSLTLEQLQAEKKVKAPK